MSLRNLPEYTDLKVWQVPVRDKDTDEETTEWRATVDGDEDVPRCNGETATEAVDVLLEHLRGDDHVSPFTAISLTDSSDWHFLETTDGRRIHIRKAGPREGDGLSIHRLRVPHWAVCFEQEDDEWWYEYGKPGTSPADGDTVTGPFENFLAAVGDAEDTLNAAIQTHDGSGGSE